MDINYIGENLFIGQLGNTFVVTGFTTALLATIAYALGTQSNDSTWRKIGRFSFHAHSVAIFGIVGTLLYMLATHQFEYHYVWQHSNSEMPMKYILSSFWEGQEGSTILWLFWHAVLGNVLIYTAKKWEQPVMAVFSSVQVFLLSMLLGIYVLEHKIGSNPFTVLLREHPDFLNLPMFRSANYLDTLDGRGLNPLLQNYWMTIHPPTLFLGFAATLVPFAFAIAGLWTRQYQQWLQPALPWTFFGIVLLGTGILMGGAWAYESLSFGGFWAWDPVENASLVPWLTLVGAGHLMLIHKSKGTSLLWLFILTTLTFFLILYSTFLTKSGVLGETSVHAFTDLGLSGQLVFYFGFYGLLSIGLIVARAKEMPKNKKEDPLWSREFWMFLGSLVLLISAFQIIFSTSIPVWNKLFGLDLAPPADPEEHYNKWQLPIAVIIALVMGVSQHLNYKRTDLRKLVPTLLRDLIISLALTILIGISLEMNNKLYLLLLLFSLYAIISNISYLFKVIKTAYSKVGSNIAHIGFAMILLGSLISMGKQETISKNSTRYDLTTLDTAYKNFENTLLMLDDTTKMGDYNVVYRGKEKEGIYVYYQVDYLDSDNNYQFSLSPFVQLNNRMGNVAEPSTKRFWDKDIFTHVTYAEIDDREVETERYNEPEEHRIDIGDTIYASNAIIVLQGIRGIDDLDKKKEFNLTEKDLLVQAQLVVYDFDTEMHTVKPHFAAVGTRPITFADDVDKIGLKLELFEIDPENEKIGIKVYEAKNKIKEFIIMKASIFPFINILWIGSILMILGTLLAIVTRIAGKRKQA